MSSLLIPVDGSEDALRAIDYVTRNQDMFAPLELHLINVQPPLVSGGVRLFINADTIRRFHEEQGQSDLAKAMAMLDQARIPYQSEVRVGPIAATIAAAAQHHQCDQIIMTLQGSGAGAKLWIGSTLVKVLLQSSVPVTVVK